MKFLQLDFFSKNPIHPNSLISNFTNTFSRTNPESVPSTAQNFFLCGNHTKFLIKDFPAGIYLLKVNNRNIRTRCEICSKLTIKTPERSFWCLYC